MFRVGAAYQNVLFAWVVDLVNVIYRVGYVKRLFVLADLEIKQCFRGVVIGAEVSWYIVSDAVEIFR